MRRWATIVCLTAAVCGIGCELLVRVDNDQLPSSLADAGIPVPDGGTDVDSDTMDASDLDVPNVDSEVGPIPDAADEEVGDAPGDAAAIDLGNPADSTTD